MLAINASLGGGGGLDFGLRRTEFWILHQGKRWPSVRGGREKQKSRATDKKSDYIYDIR